MGLTKKVELDARRVLELLLEKGPPKALAERLETSPEAVDEARCLAEEIAGAEIDAILALPSPLARALLVAAAGAGRHELLAEAAVAGDKALQREAKRIAHNLKLRGVEVALPAKQQEAPSPAPEVVAAEPPVYLSSIDARGERAIFWTRALPGRGIEVAQLVISDARGVLAASVGELSRKKFRELSEELPRRGSLTIVEAPRPVVRALLDAARVVGRATGELPATFSSWAPQVLGPIHTEPPAPLAPGGAGRPPDDEAGLVALGRSSAALLLQPELAGWAPDEAALRSCLLKLEESATSPLYLEGPAGEAQRVEAAMAAVTRCAEGYFAGEVRSRFAARLLDMGWLLEQTDRPEAARLAAATARRLAAGAPVEELPICRELFARAFAPPAAPEKPEAAPAREPSLILTPAEARAEAEAEAAAQPPSPTSKSTLIS